MLSVTPHARGAHDQQHQLPGPHYLDLTGNALLRLENPVVYIQAEGAARNPNPGPRSPASLRGDKAARLVRLLADVRPPYGGARRALAAAGSAGARTGASTPTVHQSCDASVAHDHRPRHHVVHASAATIEQHGDEAGEDRQDA